MFFIVEAILGAFTEKEAEKIAELTEKLEKSAFWENNRKKTIHASNEKESEEFLGYIRQLDNLIIKIKEKQADEYLTTANISKFITDLKTAIKRLIFTLFTKSKQTEHVIIIFKNDEILKRHIYFNLAPYLERLKEKVPKEFEEIEKFIDEAVKNKDKIVIKEQVKPFSEKKFAILNEISEKNEFLSVMFSGKITNTLARARTIGHFEPLERKLVVEGVNIFSPESVQKIGVGTAKIFRYAVAEFTKHNEKNAKGDKVKQRLLLDVKDFAAANGVDTTSTDAMKNFRRKLKNSLNTLLQSPVSWKEEIKGKEVTFSGMNYIGAYDLKADTLNIEFTLTMAEYLTSLPLIEYPRSLYSLDDREYNAFAIGEAMCIHYSIDNNVIRRTEGKLKVETLLKVTSFPTYEELKKHRWSWERKIKEPFENCLEKLYQCGFLKKWKYCYAGDVEITDEEMRAGAIDSYEKFISSLVKFELNDYEDSEIRAKKIVEKKAEKMKKLQAKQKTKKKVDNN